MNARCATFPAVALLGMCISAAQAAFIALYGGPTYDPVTRTGYLFRVSSSDPPAYDLNAVGTAVGNADLYSNNTWVASRAVRWDTSGAPFTVLSGLGGDLDGAGAINDNGIIVGSSSLPGDSVSRAVRWNPGATAPIQLSHVGLNSDSVAAGHINNSGTIFGTSGRRPVRWNAGSTPPIALPIPGRDQYGWVTAVNASGAAVGYSFWSQVMPLDFEHHGLRWDSNGMTVLQGTVFAPNAINDAGIAVGVRNCCPGSFAARWDPGTAVPVILETLGTEVRRFRGSEAIALNNSGTIVGNGSLYNGDTFLGSRALRWDSGSTIATVLPDIGADASGNAITSARFINSSGLVVGSANYYIAGANAGTHAVLWRPDGTVIDLNSLIDPSIGWTLTRADKITDTNFIVGLGLFDPDGPGPITAYDRPYLINVSSIIPEPSSLALLALTSLLHRRHLRIKQYLASLP